MNSTTIQKIKPDGFKDSEIGKIPEDWDVAELRKLTVDKNGIQTGPFGSQLHMRDYVTGGTPIITVEHLGENNIIHENLPNVSDADKHRLIKYVLHEGDIVFSRVGSVDRRALVKRTEEGWLFSGRCLRVRVNSQIISASFLSHYFGLETFKEHIRSVAVGATMPSLNTKLLSGIKVPLPSLIEQRAIASILSSLDAKIELNSQTNATLEKMAEALFRHWFVDFEFPNEKGKPYKSSGGKMVDSELGKIPTGWKVTTLGAVLELAYGKALKDKERHHGTIPVYGSNGQIGWHNEKLVDGPGIVVGRKGNPGVVTWSHTAFFAIDTTFYTVPKGAIPSMYYLFHSLRLQDLPLLGADSAVPGLNRNLAYMNKIASSPDLGYLV